MSVESRCSIELMIYLCMIWEYVTKTNKIDSTTIFKYLLTVYFVQTSEY